MREAQLHARSIKKLVDVDVFEESRKTKVVEYRSLLVHILYTVENYTLYKIRDFFRANGKKYDHSTALHALRNFEMYANYNKDLLVMFDELVLLGRTNNMKIKIISKQLEKLESYQLDYLLNVLEKSEIEKKDFVEEYF